MLIQIQVTLLILSLANVMLHSIGTYLLLSLYKTKSRGKVQITYLIQLSISENLMSFLSILSVTLRLSYIRGDFVTIALQYIQIVQGCGMALMVYLSMIYLTADRLVMTILNIKYPLYWDNNKAKTLLIISWIVACLVTVCALIINNYFEVNWTHMVFTYYYSVLNVIVIVLALTTYIFIFRKYKKSRDKARKRNTHSSTDDYTRESVIDAFRDSKFFITMLLISTYLIFIVGANIAYLLATMIWKKDPIDSLTACFLSAATSNLVDACIYIFIQKDVKKLLLKRLRLCRE